jgi:hypothetical protein
MLHSLPSLSHWLTGDGFKATHTQLACWEEKGNLTAESSTLFDVQSGSLSFALLLLASVTPASVRPVSTLTSFSCMFTTNFSHDCWVLLFTCVLHVVYYESNYCYSSIPIPSLALQLGLGLGLGHMTNQNLHLHNVSLAFPSEHPWLQFATETYRTLGKRLLLGQATRMPSTLKSTAGTNLEGPTCWNDEQTESSVIQQTLSDYCPVRKHSPMFYKSSWMFYKDPFLPTAKSPCLKFKLADRGWWKMREGDGRWEKVTERDGMWRKVMKGDERLSNNVLQVPRCRTMYSRCPGVGLCTPGAQV